MRLLFFLGFVCAFAKELPQNVKVDLIKPIYANQTMKTEDGGVITADGMRIQARKIEYINRPKDGVQTVKAEGDLLVEYGGRFFVGDSLEYNFISKRGKVINGRTNIDLWFMGGKTIQLLPNRSFHIIEPFLTTSETVDREWDVLADHATIYPDAYARATNIRFRFMHVPIFWIPKFKTSFTPQPDTPVRYGYGWDKGQGPRVSMRYRIYSWDDLDIYSRLDFRPDFTKLGIAGVFAFDYDPKHRDAHFLSRNFVTKDTFFNDDDPDKNRFRFRVQGKWMRKHPNKRTSFRSSWDWFNDKNLPLTFQGDEFELNTAKRTEALVRHLGDDFIAASYVRPRINSFQGFKQELPTLDLALRPTPLGNTGAVMENRFQTSYLDYVYSDDIDNLLPDFESLRLSTNNNIYRAFHTPYFSFTPLAGFTGLFYSNSPTNRTAGQAIFRYEGLLNTKFEKRGASYKHRLEPYAHFRGLTSPTTSVDRTFIFGLKDGLNRLNMLRTGLRSDLFSSCELMPTLSCDLYTNAFFNADPYKLLIPKSYLDILWNIKNVSLGAHGAYNFEESVLDYSNLSLLWTLNENIATHIEFRHRSRFDWRKDDHQNYILDITRQIDELLETPISDGRNTFLTRLQIKLHPKWILRLQMHQGWGRKNEPGYNEGRADILTALATSWRLRTTLTWTARTKGITGVGGALNLSNQF